jgi:hypothetical protein
LGKKSYGSIFLGGGSTPGKIKEEE